MINYPSLKSRAFDSVIFDFYFEKENIAIVKYVKKICYLIEFAIHVELGKW